MNTDGTTASPSSTQEERLDPRRWLALGVVLVAAFMDLLDAGIVFLALPSIGQDLHAGYGALQWVAAGDTLAFALVLITAGRLGDIVGRRRLFLVGVAGFTGASPACAAAQSPELLVAARVLQGAMAATMIPQILSLIQANFPPQRARRRLRPVRRGGRHGQCGRPPRRRPAAADQPAGAGVAVDLPDQPARGCGHPGRCRVLVAESRAPRALRLDPVGVAILTVGLLLVLYPLVQGRELGWPTWTFVAMVAAVAVGGFVGWERHRPAPTAPRWSPSACSVSAPRSRQRRPTPASRSGRSSPRPPTTPAHRSSPAPPNRPCGSTPACSWPPPCSASCSQPPPDPTSPNPTSMAELVGVTYSMSTVGSMLMLRVLATIARRRR